MPTSEWIPDVLDQTLIGEDATDVVAALELSSLAGTPRGDGRPPTPIATFAAECVYLRLLTRASPAAPRPSEQPVAVDDMLLQAGALAAGDVMAAVPDDPGDHAGLLSAPTRFSINQTLFYDPAIAWAEPPRLKALFDPFGDELHAAIGLDIDEVLAVLTELNRQSLAFVLREAGVAEAPTSMEHAIALARAGVAAGAGRTVRRGAGRELTVSPAELAQRAALTEHQIAAFLDVFAVDAPCAACGARFAEAVWMLRRRPVLRWGDRLSAPVAGRLLMAIRPALESALRAAGREVAERYLAHKARWLEEKAVRLFDLLDPDELFRKLHYPLDDGQLTERDILVRVDLLALAVEAKAGGITPRARAGGVASQQTALDRLVYEAIDQARGLIAALDTAEVTGVDRQDSRVAVDIGDVTRFIPVAVTLEDVGGVTARSQALFTESDDVAARPVVLNIDDVEWYGRELRSPSRLLHYLVVRQRIADAAVAVYDEADWFRLYVQAGGAGVQEWIDGLAGLPTQIVGHSSEARRGMPDPGIVERPAPFADVAERWRGEARDGWLEGCFALFDLSDDQVQVVPLVLQQARDRARAEDGFAIATIRPRGDRSCALHILVPPDGSGEIDLNELAPSFMAQAEDAERHIIAGSRRGSVDDLTFGGLASIAPAREEAATSP